MFREKIRIKSILTSFLFHTKKKLTGIPDESLTDTDHNKLTHHPLDKHRTNHDCDRVPVAGNTDAVAADLTVLCYPRRAVESTLESTANIIML